MLDLDLALELLKKYGYSSTNSHPYLYQSGDSVGICYKYVDEDYGPLERIKIFDSLDDLDDFLSKMDWLKKNGLNYHVRMCLDDYESINPKTLFLRNEKLMIQGEMDDIETFDFKEAQREQMDQASKILYEAGDLFLIYDEIKKRQLDYLLKIIGLKNQLRQKYYDLQMAVDKYNKVKIERDIVKIPEVPDSGGIDLQMEISLKDRYNIYIKEVPPVEEGAAFLKEVWELNKNLELNTRYYDALREETEVRNEMKIVEKKLELMEKLNDNVKPLFGTDLVGRFRKINKSLGSTISQVSKEIVEQKVSQVKDKYKFFDKLDLLYVSDYLREAIQNSNYEDLSIKYAKGVPSAETKKSRTPLNEIASSLFVQYKNSLFVEEQATLVIYSNPKFRRICDAILDIPDFNNLTPKQIIKKINGIKGFSKLKSECYISVRNRINDPENQTLKASLFNNYDFTSFETFIGCLARELYKLTKIDNKMILTGDINMYIPVTKEEDVTNKKYVLVTNDINTLAIEAKNSNNYIGITLLKENLPVLYSPYYLDLGDLYSKNASPKMEIKEVINFELLIDVSDVAIKIDKNKTNVINYYSELEVEGNVSIAKDIKSSGKTIFIKYAFIPTSSIEAYNEASKVMVEEEPATTPVEANSAYIPQDGGAVEQVTTPVVNDVSPNPFTPPVVDNYPEIPTTPVVESPVENSPVENSPVVLTSVNNGVNASNLNQSLEKVMQQAVASGSMVAIASQEASGDALNSTGVVNEGTTPEPVIQTEETSPVIPEFSEPTIPEPASEEKTDEESDVSSLDKNQEEKANLVINEKKENVDDSDSSNDEKEKDLDKLLDTLATTLPKDLSKTLEDTSKMELFANMNDSKDNEKKDQLEAAENNKTEKTGEVTLDNKENPSKEPVKTQIVKKVITKPDGTKKVVMVRRVVSAKNSEEQKGLLEEKKNQPVPSILKEEKQEEKKVSFVPKEGEVIVLPDGRKVRRVVRKPGDPVKTDGKRVILKKVVKQLPKEEEK